MYFAYRNTFFNVITSLFVLRKVDIPYEIMAREHKKMEVFGMRKRQFEWENYASVEMLARLMKVSKRRIQQLLQPMIVEGKVDVVIGVFNSDTTQPFARPIYRLVK